MLLDNIKFCKCRHASLNSYTRSYSKNDAVSLNTVRVPVRRVLNSYDESYVALVWVQQWLDCDLHFVLKNCNLCSSLVFPWLESNTIIYVGYYWFIDTETFHQYALWPNVILSIIQLQFPLVLLCYRWILIKSLSLAFIFEWLHLK